MGLPATIPQPFEVALRTKVQELFPRDTAQLHSGRTMEGDPLLEIRTTLGLEDAELRLRAVESWAVEHYPYDSTVVGLLHVSFL